MKLSIVILNYNVRYFLELCLKSVEAAISSIDAEIIVVDNNSTDESCKMVKQLFQDVILIEIKENFGFSKGNNQGVKIAKGEYICILNPDTVVAEDTFTSIISFSQEKENIGIVGCKLIDGTGQFLPESKRNIPTVKVAANKIFGNSKKYYANYINQDETGKVDILVGAFMFIKRNVYRKVNGFDEDYFMYGEDIDLSYRVLNAGFDNYYFADTKIIHYKGESTLKNKNYAKDFYNSMQIFYKKHFKKNVLFDIFVWLGIKSAYAFRTEQKSIQKETNSYYLISDRNNKALEKKLGKDIILNSKIENDYNNAEIVFDANILSYKEIINQLSKNKSKTGLTFKILPNNSNFIIGSDNSFSQGEVIVFE
ncbi:glycosyltransferase family 2 protein [Flavobacteriaceae bacterium AH-315-B10]|nr:glycosyltransferase family 2 protein [Flavobacteriaceae bacterium AH-315-B10]